MPLPREQKKLSSPQSVETPLIEDWLGEQLDKSLRFKLASHPDVFYASNLGEDARQLYLRYLGLIVEDIGVVEARMMGSGKALNNRWEEDLKKAGLLVIAEKPVTPHPIYPLHGRLDFIVKSKNSVTSRYFLVELKTKGPDTFEGVNEPDYLALCQWTFYSVQEGIVDGYIIYECMGKPNIKYFQLHRDDKTVIVYVNGKLLTMWPDLVQIIENKLAYTMWCLSNKKFPEKCVSCLMRCKYPELCRKQESEKGVVSQREWENIIGLVRTGS